MKPNFKGDPGMPEGLYDEYDNDNIDELDIFDDDVITDYIIQSEEYEPL